MKAALYIRVSTAEQVENYSIESQRERLEAFCKSKDWEIHDIYIDGGFSGATMDRPALTNLLNDLKNLDVVVVYKLDRLSRSQRDTLELIEDHFLANNIDFVSITETLDTSTPFGRAMIGILSVFAQLERETIAERMRNGHIKRAEEGLRGMGGDYDPAGYGRKDGALFVKEDEAKHIQDAFNLYEQFHSITKVQKKLKEMGYTVWRFRRYRDILANRLYCGYVSFAGKHYKGKHDAIIPKEQFERVQVLLSRHKGNNAHKAKESLLSGLIRCGKCGENYVTYQSIDKVNKQKYYRYYICRSRRFPSEYGHKCMNKTWNYKKLEELIISQFQSFSHEKTMENKEITQINYDALLKKIDEKVERLLTLYIDGSSNIDKALLDKQTDKLNEEKRRLYQLKEQQEDRINSSLSQEQFEQFNIDLLSSDFQTRQAIIHKLISQITIYGEDIEISWTF